MTCTAACLGRSLWEENRIRLKHLRWEPHQYQWLYSEVRRDPTVVDMCSLVLVMLCSVPP